MGNTDPAERRAISLEELRELLRREYGGEVLVTLIPKGEWVLDPWARMSGARTHDRFLLGRLDRAFFDCGERDPNVAPWGQLEIREEPLVVALRPDGRRIVGYIRVEVAASGRIRVTNSSISKGLIHPGPTDLEVGVLRTNAARIDGDVVVLRRDVDVELEEGGGVWQDRTDLQRREDQMVHEALKLVGIQ